MGVRGKRQGDPGAVKGKDSPWFPPLGSETRLFLICRQGLCAGQEGCGREFGATQHPYAASGACAGAVWPMCAAACGSPPEWGAPPLRRVRPGALGLWSSPRDGHCRAHCKDTPTVHVQLAQPFLPAGRQSRRGTSLWN